MARVLFIRQRIQSISRPQTTSLRTSTTRVPRRPRDRKQSTGSRSLSYSSSPTPLSSSLLGTTDCPITQSYAETGPCGKLFRAWRLCDDNDKLLAPKLFDDWLQCLEQNDPKDEQLGTFFGSSTTAAAYDEEDDDTLDPSSLEVNNSRVLAAWETFIETDLAALQATSFPDFLRPRVEWTLSGRVTILFSNDSTTHSLVAVLAQSSSASIVDSPTSDGCRTTKSNPVTRQLLAAAAPHNLLARRILSFQLPSDDTASLYVSAVFEMDNSPSDSMPLLCTFQVTNPATQNPDAVITCERTGDSINYRVNEH